MWCCRHWCGVEHVYMCRFGQSRQWFRLRALQGRHFNYKLFNKIRNKHARHKAIPILMTVRIVQLMRIRHRHWARSAHQVIHTPNGANGVRVHPIVPMSTMQRNERKHEHVSASPIQLPMKTRGVMSRMTVLSWRRHKTVKPIFAPFVPISLIMPSVPSDPIPSALIRRRMAPPKPHASVKRHTSEFFLFYLNLCLKLPK